MNINSDTPPIVAWANDHILDWNETTSEHIFIFIYPVRDLIQMKQRVAAAPCCTHT